MAEDDELYVHRWFREIQWTADQARARFGDDRLPEREAAYRKRETERKGSAIFTRSIHAN